MNYTPQKEAKKYYIGVKDSNPVYVWGFNYFTLITRETIEKAYKDYHSSTYDRTYYENKLKEGNGRPGSDCSGMHYDLSGYDTTAQGYYDRCTSKGSISKLPISDLCLLFRGKSTDSIKHTGIYLGNSMCLHMKSSKENCVYESVDKHGWTEWGYGDFIDYSSPLDAKPILIRVLKIKMSGTDVKLLQDQLILKGYEPGIIDGDFGSKTENAVKKFQKDNKLPEDGIVGKATCKKLGMLWRGPNY